MMQNALLLVAWAVSVAAQLETHVPSVPVGVVVQNGTESTHVHLDVFYDLLCPDSKANWPALQQLMSHFKSDLRVRIVLFPLPFHHHAFFTAQAAYTVASKKESIYADFVSLMFERQAELKVGPAVNFTEDEVRQHIASIVSSGNFGITSSEIMAGFEDDAVYERAVLDWKHSCDRTISDTPGFAINGIKVPEAGTFSMSDWVKVIESLVNKKST
ncbi:uncharacterized protein LOC134183701 [Corticium candelabrum]|uniref:uncharacterized protein LOC134183701 n=1 Tax=Corticium candelabrum TaxID=121492 RepID=UPI002E256B4B|nr:uncharacterized protein LOC134183701 [Corticium candelabrum]